MTTRPRVLILEDECDIAAFVGAFFRASGLDVVHVDPRSAGDASEAVLRHRPHCVMLDLGLVGMSGLDVLGSLGAAGMPVVVVTADVRESTRRAVLERGAELFVGKPFNVRDLFVAIDELVHRPHAGSPVAGRA